MKQPRQKNNSPTPTSAEVYRLLGILARVTRRVVDEEQARATLKS